MPRSAHRLAHPGLPGARAVAVGAGIATLGMAVAMLAAGGLGAPIAAQSTLREAYALVDTWDGTTQQSAPGAVLYPAGIDVTPAAVYVADRGNHRVEVFDRRGVFQQAWGRKGSGPGELRDPQDVAVDGGRVFVADTGNRRIVVLAADGQPLDAWTVPGLGAPWGIAARAGKVYVTSPESDEVVVLAADGSVTGRWAALTDPRGVDVGSDGRVYVADPSASAVFVYAPDGKMVFTLPQPNLELAPRDVAADENGDLYVQSRKALLWYTAGETVSRQALYLDDLQGVAILTGNAIYASRADDARDWHGIVAWAWRPREGVVAAEWPLLNYPPGRLNRPHAIHAGADGRIWVLDGWPRVQAFGTDGVPQAQWRPRLTPQRLFEPVDIAVNARGEALVGEPTWLSRLRADGTLSNTLRLRRGRDTYWLTALAGHAGGRRLTLLDSTAVTAREYGVTRTVQETGNWPLDRAGAGWTFVGDIAAPPADPRGRLYSVNRWARTIGVYEDRALVATWPVDGIPVRAAVGPDDHVFVLTTDGVVTKHAPDGAAVAAWDAGAYSAAASDVADLTVDAAGRVYTVDRLAGTIRVWAVDPAATPEPPLVRRGACRVRGDKRAAPASVQLGGTVTVTLSIGGDCPSMGPGADIVLAIDRSGSMNETNKITDTIRAALSFADSIDFARDRVGVVAFNNGASLVQPLTQDAAAVKRAIAGLKGLGGTNIAAALQVSTAELGGPRARPGMQPIVILLTDGKDDFPDTVLSSAAAARAQGVRVFTIGFGDIDPMIMVRAASSPEDSYYAPDGSKLVAIYAEIARRLTATVLARTMTIVDDLPANMRYVGPRAGPPPAVSGQTLTWTLTDVPLAGLALAYQVEPRQLGRHPTNAGAAAEFVDGLDRAGRLRFPVPEVGVLGAPPTRTNTPTPFPTATPRPTDTPTPTDTATPPPPIFLPVLLAQRCEDAVIRADVAIVMDTSGSMREPARPEDPSRSRLAAAVDAAKRSVEILLALEGNRAAIVSFNEAAALVQPLTRDRGVLIAALDGLGTFQGTRIDLGLDVATTELTGPNGVPANNRVIVLLTDGRATGVENAAVIAAADRAKAAGVHVFTIGLGADADIDVDLLQTLASRPDYFFKAPDAAQLAQIYERIAFTIKCVNLTWP